MGKVGALKLGRVWAEFSGNFWGFPIAFHGKISAFLTLNFLVVVSRELADAGWLYLS